MDQSQNQKYQQILSNLQHQFTIQQLLSVRDLAKIYGMKPKTIYNQLSNKTFPVKHVKTGGHPRWRIIDIAKHLSELEPQQ